MKVSYASGSGGPAQASAPGGGGGFAAGASNVMMAAPAVNVNAIVGSMSLQEVWDVLNDMKTMIGDQSARSVLEEYPQLVEGLNLALKRMGMSASEYAAEGTA